MIIYILESMILISDYILFIMRYMIMYHKKTYSNVLLTKLVKPNINQMYTALGLKRAYGKKIQT